MRNDKNKYLKFKIGLFVLITLFIFGLVTAVYISTDRELADVPDKIIRLHVVANSDSPEDQQLKLYVRDEVIGRMTKKFEGLKDINEVRRTIQESIGEIEAIAQDAIRKSGKQYDVSAALVKTDFPTKVYGNLTLPAGYYQALNIVIGNGQGKNWWCVMFPPLCFIDVAHGVVAEETMGELKKVLTDEEYELLLSSKTEGDIPVKLRFKLVELAKDMNLRIARIGKTK
ncbi:MAG: stage II sporulation protein R [Caulobacteraceae bacterium]